MNGGDHEKSQNDCNSQFILLQFIVHVSEHCRSVTPVPVKPVITTQPITLNVPGLYMRTDVNQIETSWQLSDKLSSFLILNSQRNKIGAKLSYIVVCVILKCAQNKAGQSVRNSSGAESPLSFSRLIHSSSAVSEETLAAAAEEQTAGNLQCMLATRC